MKSQIGALCALLVVFAVAVPDATAADKDHGKWIETQSISMSENRVGATTRRADGQYKTPQGQFLVVAGGKVVAAGRDYRSYRPGTSRAGTAQTAPGSVAGSNQQQAAGLLLPAVQAARAAAPENAAEPAAPGGFQPPPQKGIEPDEIDSKVAGRQRAALPMRVGAGRASVQQMMLRLKPRHPVAVPQGGGMSPTSVQTKPAEPPKYEIAECGTAASPMICCHHEAGDGSSCNLFKILCENAGGTAQGDGESAACSDW